jgi:hypothetical protein
MTDWASIVANEDSNFSQTPMFSRYNSQNTNSNQQFQDYLMQLMQANPQNSNLQESLLGYFLDSMNPANATTDQNRTTDLGLAESLLGSGNTDATTLGNKILAGYYPDYMTGTSSTSTTGYYDTIRASAKQALNDMVTSGAVDRNEYQWYNFLANATDDQIDQYDALKGSKEEATRWENLLNPEKWRRRQMLPGYAS